MRLTSEAGVMPSASATTLHSNTLHLQGTLMLYRDMTVRACDAVAQQIFLCTDERQPLRRWLDRFVFVDRSGARIPTTDSPLLRAWAGHDIRRFVCSVRQVEGDAAPIWIMMSAAGHEDPDVQCVIGCVDVTELIRVVHEQEEMVDIVAHDLRSPLRLVRSYLKIMAEEYSDRLSGEGAEYLGFVAESAARMHAHLSGVTEFSRACRRAYDMRTVDLKASVEEAQVALYHAIAESDAEIEVDHLPIVRADRQRMTAVFQHLLDNAIKFRSNERPLRVSITHRPEGTGWRIAVQDNGIGFEPRFTDAVFKLFRRLDTSTRYPGVGLGLPLCKRIIERHGGTMGIESTPDIGTTCWFQLQA